MTPHHSFLTRFVLVGAAGALSLPGLSDPPARAVLPAAHLLPPTQAKNASLIREIGRLPLSFESNEGQTDARVRFLTHTGDSTLFLTPSEAVFTLPTQTIQPNSQPAQRSDRKASRAAEKRLRTALRMQMVGANPKATALTQQPLEGRTNYFIGKDPSHWHAGVPTFGKVGFQGVYKGVDLVYYGNRKHLEYDFVVAPHADPKQIQLHFAGAQGVHINGNGDLVVWTEGRELKWQKPTVYQQGKAGKHTVAAHFRLKRLQNGQEGVRFALGRYDHTRPLIIDPVLLYSTYLGGSNSTGATRIAVDSAGNAYVTGTTNSTDFPTTAGAFQIANSAAAGSYNVFVSKLNPTGTTLLYSTYLGGSGNNTAAANGIVIDGAGNACVTGTTQSTDFPTTPGAFQPTDSAPVGSAIGFVTKLNATGTALIYSTYLGGSKGANATGIAMDSGGNVFIAGATSSIDFPTTPGAFQPVNRGPVGASNAFVTKLNPTGTALVYSTYLGGTTSDGANGIAIDSTGNAYVAGAADSTDFPVTPGAFQPVNNGGSVADNAFVTKLNSTGTALVYSTYLGGRRGTQALGLTVDSAGDAYVVGLTEAPDFPVTPGVFQPTNGADEGTFDAFVTKLNPTGTALVYSTYLGGKRGALATSVAVDSKGNAYVTGLTRSANFPTTPGAFQRVNHAGPDPLNFIGSNAFLAKFNPAGTALAYSTYLGGSQFNGDSAAAVVIDNNSSAYLVGQTRSLDFPVTPGAFQTVDNVPVNSSDGFVTRLFTVPVLPDFNNDNFTDLLLQNPTTGEIGSWFMQGSTKVGGAPFSLTPPADFALVGAGDFSGDGSTSLVLQSKTTNEVALWFTSGTNHAVIPGGHFLNTTPEAGWKVVGVGDFNGDGKSDVVYQNQTTGRIAVWFMNGYLVTGGVLLPVSPLSGWNVVGAGDLNADGFADLIFQNQTTGQIALWYLNGTTYVSGLVMPTVPGAGWSIASVGDFNGDGNADLLFTNAASAQAVVWYLQNGNFMGGGALSSPLPTGWTIVGPR